MLPTLTRLRGLLRDDVRILAYHRVLDCDPTGFAFDAELVSATSEGFRAQMQLIHRQFNPVRFDELLYRLESGRSLPPRSILITFDDGYDDNYRVAFPILQDLGMSAMFFVSTGHVDSGVPYAYDWLVHMVCSTTADRLSLPELGIDMALPAALQGRREVAAGLLDRIKSRGDEAQASLISRLEQEWNFPREAGHADCRPMTWAQLREMQGAGMEIGSHGVNHKMLAKLPPAQMAEEVFGSKRTLERELDMAVKVLSYPVGGPDAFDANVVETARAAGYRLACSYVPGTSPLHASSRYSLRRLPVERDMDAAWFEAMITLPELFVYPVHMRTG